MEYPLTHLMSLLTHQCNLQVILHPIVYHTRDIPIIIVGTNDYNSSSFEVTFEGNKNNTLVKIPIYKDDKVEGNETFMITLSLSPSLGPGLTVDDSASSEGVIMDSTGKRPYNTMSVTNT